MRRNVPEDQQTLPPYTYVPGITPHPVSAPGGHSRPGRANAGEPVSPIARGLVLFNSGYYWEAHEAWEQAWIGAGRHGPVADSLKGLIKLAAAGVKCLEGNRSGAVRHAARVLELLEGNSPESARELRQHLDLDWQGVADLARSVWRNPPLADDAGRDAARQGGVPILGRLPQANG